MMTHVIVSANTCLLAVRDMAGQQEGWKERLEEAAALGKKASPCCAHNFAWTDGAKGGCERDVAK